MNQRALLVEGIRPVLPLIRNTPYGKRIQNKLQREQMDSYGGYHHNQQTLVNMALGNQGMSMSAGHGAGRHMPHQTLQAPSLADAYGAQNGLYSMGGAPAMQTQALHSMQPHSIDGYVLQNASSHSHSPGLTPPLSQAGAFSAMSSYGNVGSFPAIGVTDPYQQRSFGYGM